METKLTESSKPYLLRNDMGDRLLFGKQVVKFLGNRASSGGYFELTLLSGGKGEGFPTHVHEQMHEAMYVVDGKVELILNGESITLTPGDYAHIPAGTIHSYEMQSHRTRFYIFAVNGEMEPFYKHIGKEYHHVEQAVIDEHKVSTEKIREAAQLVDIKLMDDVQKQPDSNIEIIRTSQALPNSVSPYVIESGAGENFLAGDQLYNMLASQANTNNEFLALVTEGPAGDKIVDHYHEKHTETFLCLDGKMTMWANGEEVQLEKGDFLHVPAGTEHSFRLDSSYTKFIGFLASGLFEKFFRLLGEPYEAHNFPEVSKDLEFGRVLQHINELDLKIANK
jgi:quercetin 2,3-dioxygenase